MLQIPGVTDVVHHFLEPTFADSRFYEELEPSGAEIAVGLLIGAVLAFSGIAIAYRLWVQSPAAPGRVRERFAGLHGFLVRKWYFDEVIDTLVVRPMAWVGRFARNTFERVVVNGVFVGGSSGAVKAGSSAVRAIQSGFLRFYAALLLLGLCALALYFLVLASSTIHLSIVLFWPLALAVLGALAPRRLAPWVALLGSLVPLGYATVLLFDFDTGAAGCSTSPTTSGSPTLGVHYKLGLDGLNLWLIALATLLFAASALWIVFRPYERPKLFAFHLGLAETALLGAFMAQDLALFVLFFDLMLVPFAFLVLGWGGPERVAATLKFIIYTLVGSLLMLAGAVATAVLSRERVGRAS